MASFCHTTALPTHDATLFTYFAKQTQLLFIFNFLAPGLPEPRDWLKDCDHNWTICPLRTSLRSSFEIKLSQTKLKKNAFPFHFLFSRLKNI